MGFNAVSAIFEPYIGCMIYINIAYKCKLTILCYCPTKLMGKRIRNNLHSLDKNKYSCA